MGNAIYYGLCISQSADKAGHGLKLPRGKEGAVIDRVTEVNILQVRACRILQLSIWGSQPLYPLHNYLSKCVRVNALQAWTHYFRDSWNICVRQKGKCLLLLFISGNIGISRSWLRRICFTINLDKPASTNTSCFQRRTLYVNHTFTN